MQIYLFFTAGAKGWFAGSLSALHPFAWDLPAANHASGLDKKLLFTILKNPLALKGSPS